MLRSMTGFGRCLVENDACSQQWEVKSVNGKYLDIKWRLPPMIRYLEPNLEKIARKYASRGRVEISLRLNLLEKNALQASFDNGQANAMLEELKKLAEERGEEFKTDYSFLLGIQNLWSEPELDDDQDITGLLENGLAIALDDWNDSRSVEGKALGLDLQERIGCMEEWTQAISARAPEIREEKITILRDRLNEACASNNIEPDETRLLQEIVILADKLDVSEELIRLGTHLERLRQLLRQGEDVGRRLDFTLQECFREINTCGNKISDASISRVIVDFKNELEKCREQVQNLE